MCNKIDFMWQSGKIWKAIYLLRKIIETAQRSQQMFDTDAIYFLDQNLREYQKIGKCVKNGGSWDQNFTIWLKLQGTKVFIVHVLQKKTWKILRILQNIIARLNSACPALVRTIVLAPRTKLLCLYFFTMSVSFGSTNRFKLGLLLLWLVSCSYNITHMHQGSMKRRKILGEGNYIFVE